MRVLAGYTGSVNINFHAVGEGKGGWSLSGRNRQYKNNIINSIETVTERIFKID